MYNENDELTLTTFVGLPCDKAIHRPNDHGRMYKDQESCLFNSWELDRIRTKINRIIFYFRVEQSSWASGWWRMNNKSRSRANEAVEKTNEGAYNENHQWRLGSSNIQGTWDFNRDRYLQRKWVIRVKCVKIKAK